MSKIATVSISWIRSPSADVSERQLIVTKDGETTTYDVGPEVSDYQIDVEASKSISFKTIVKDSEGLTATSETATFTVGDLEAPLPDTGLTADIVSVRDDNPDGMKAAKKSKTS